ncbi:MAG: ribbon-helix-helix domain-containing protein [Lautropia sp.]|nr:ribbon-helix-helix domain-containing protein [Lautropia sp.]
MCDFYVSADPILYESRTRTVRIRGVSTSIRLENFIWDTLAGMAKDEGMTTNALIVTFHDEILQSRGDVQNFTSFLRVTCLRYLDRKCGQLAERLLQAQAHVPAPAASVFGGLGEGSAPRSTRLN